MIKNILFALILTCIAGVAYCQEFKLPIKDYVVTFNSASEYKYNDTGNVLVLRILGTSDSAVILYQEIQNRKGQCINIPSNITVPRIAVKYLFDYVLNLEAINAYLANYHIEAIKPNN